MTKPAIISPSAVVRFPANSDFPSKGRKNYEISVRSKGARAKIDTEKVFASPFFVQGLFSHFINIQVLPVTHRSRDNFPNPVQIFGSYAPVNAPALDDLFDFFNFNTGRGH